MKAIETEYKGILFRSRLEARWAILFDSLELEWVYEPECFELTNGEKYTPDFYLPKYDYYIEIKPSLEWMENSYHTGRYNLFDKNLSVFSNSFPCLNTLYHVSVYGFTKKSMGGLFVPNSKYEPFYWSGYYAGEKYELYEGEYDENINEVKQFRFYK